MQAKGEELGMDREDKIVIGILVAALLAVISPFVLYGLSQHILQSRCMEQGRSWDNGCQSK